MKLIGICNMTIDELKNLHEIAYKLSIGRDPVTNLQFSQDTILNCSMIKEYNRHMAEILEELITTTEASFSLGKRKLNFYLSESEKKSIKFSEKPISVSAFVYLLNGVSSPYVKKLHAVDVTSWLMKQGYLAQKEMKSGNKYKVATAKGNEIGIINEQHKNSYGNIYFVNMYNEAAQRFIVDNLDNILKKKID